MAIRTADIEALRSKCSFQLLIKPIARSKTSHKKNRLWSSRSIIHTISKSKKFLTEISVSEVSHCSLMDFTMHWTDGSKKEATSDLRKNIAQSRSRYHVGLESYPRSFNWPERILSLGSLSRMLPNLIYWASSAFLNLSLVVLSKHFTMWGISPEKRDCPSKSSDHDLKAHTR